MRLDMRKLIILLLLIVLILGAAVAFGWISLTQTGTEEARLEVFGQVFALRLGKLAALRDAGRLWLDALPSALADAMESALNRLNLLLSESGYRPAHASDV